MKSLKHLWFSILGKDRRTSERLSEGKVSHTNKDGSSQRGTPSSVLFHFRCQESKMTSFSHFRFGTGSDVAPGGNQVLLVVVFCFRLRVGNEGWESLSVRGKRDAIRSSRGRQGRLLGVARWRHGKRDLAFYVITWILVCISGENVHWRRTEESKKQS